MAINISLTSGSILNGNPITFDIVPSSVGGTPAFHRVVIDVTCGISGGNNEELRQFEVLRQFEPVLTEGKTISTDISSVLRTFRDSYKYSAQDEQFPMVKFKLKVFDEYMLDGEVHTTAPVYFPAFNKYLTTIFGKFSDMERLTSSGFKSVQRLSRKPVSMPQLACVGESLVYSRPFESPQDLLTSEAMANPVAVVADLTEVGLHAFDGIKVFVLPAAEAECRRDFRFINSFGVMESISVPQNFSQSVPMKSNSYVVTQRESFSHFSRSAVKKIPDSETWQFSSDPLDEDWLRWYLYEFLMAEYVWIKIDNVWVPCEINASDEEVTFIDKTKNDMLTVTFKAKLGVDGSPLL